MRREGLYDDLVAAAIELTSSRLPLAIPSLRAVARACGVSATAVYRHFSSQGDLNRAILMAVDSAFIAAVAGVDDPERPPLERLHRLAHSYLDWGVTNPGLYQLRFESADQLGADYVRTDGADNLLVHIDDLLRITDAAPGVTAEDLWTGLHGIVSLRIHKPERAWSDGPGAQVDRLLAVSGLTG